MSTQNAQRQALQDRLASIAAQEGAARALLSDKNVDLALAPDNQKLRDEVEALERELAGHTNERARIELALQELKRRDSAEGRRRMLKTAHDAAADVGRLGKRGAKVAAELIKHAEALGPLLSELDGIMAERLQHARTVLRTLPEREANRAHLYTNVADWRRGVVAAPLAAALWRSGLGRLGPDVSPWLTLTSVRDGKGDPYLTQDLRSLLEEAIARADEHLAHGMKTAVQSLEAQAKG